jgi:hypothetical protein
MLCLFINCNGQTGIIYPVKSIAIKLPKDAGKVLKNIASVFIRRIEQRSGAKVTIGTAGELTIDLSINTDIGKDGSSQLALDHSWADMILAEKAKALKN